MLIHGAEEDAATAAARIREALEQAWAWSALSSGGRSRRHGRVRSRRDNDGS